nr:serine/threonine-protein phosphatase BSL3 isoform X2 [Ipomoea batatas]
MSQVIAHLLKPRGWKPPVRRQFFLDCNEIADLCDTAERIFSSEPTVLQLKAPIKIFGDLHGQFGDLMRLFDEYGSPSTADYLFLGDYVDRGLFNWLPLAALIENKIICMHGGIGRSINHVEQIENIQRPITMEAGSIVLMDLLWLVCLTLSSYHSNFFLYNPCVNTRIQVAYPKENDINMCKSTLSGLTQQKMIVLKVCVQMLEVLDWLLLG